MGFVLRAVFWLGLAMVILPPEARLGGSADDVDIRDVDVGLELHNAIYSAWAMATQVASTCDTNPELCDAGTNLWKATVATTESLATEVQDGWQSAAFKPDENTRVKPKPVKKIQARVE